jgi:hypothetical protein
MQTADVPAIHLRDVQFSYGKLPIGSASTWARPDDNLTF